MPQQFHLKGKTRVVIREKLIKKCKKNDRKAQRALYDHLSPMLYYTCKRYLNNEHDVQDVLAESFVKIFNHLDQLKNPKALEGWAKRIAVNQSLQKIRKSINFNMYLDDMVEDESWAQEPSVALEEQDLLKLVNQLPDGCKTIFNLFVIEGYAHQEIAEQLSISVGTSKSQLHVAKTKLQSLVNQYYFSKTS